MARTQPQLAMGYLVTLGKLVSGKLRRIDKMIAGVTGDQKVKKDPDLKKLVFNIRRAMKCRKDIF